MAGQPFIVSSHWVPRGWRFEVGGGRLEAVFRKRESPGHSRSLPPQRGQNANLPGHNEATACGHPVGLQDAL